MDTFNITDDRLRELISPAHKSATAGGDRQSTERCLFRAESTAKMDRREYHRLRQCVSRQLTMAGVLSVLFCLPLLGATFRWSASSNRIFVEDGGSATLSNIKAALPSAPLDLVDPTNKVWLLRAELWIKDGATLVLHGTAAGGDVNELRLQSVNSAGPGCGCVVSVTADWGNLDINSTKIISWDTTSGGPDLDYQTNDRAFVRVRSSLETNGVTPLESRMDITNSEIAYLGYNGSEAYGLVWKVVGTDPNPTNSIFDKVNVYGNVVNSHIHDNYFGLYMFGAEGMQCLTNEVDHNAQYGFDPHDDSDNLLIQGNNVHHNGDHGIIASLRCDHLTIRGNTCWSNAENGIILHRNSNYGLIEDNRCYDNGDSGIALTATFQTTVRNNWLARNASAGVRLDLGSADNLIVNNECVSNALYGFYFYRGSDTPEPSDDGRPKRNLFAGNWIHDTGGDGIRLADSDDNIFTTNTFAANGPINAKLRFQRGLRNVLDGDSIPVAVSVRTEGDSGSPASTFIRHQSFMNVELGTNSSTVFQDAQGRIFQPDEAAVGTEVSTNGSALTLTSAGIGASTTVVARNFWAGAAPGTASIHHLIWPASALARKQWTANAASIGQNLNFLIGDLLTNTAYLVRKGNLEFTNLNSNAQGYLQFSDTASTTNGVVYTAEVFNSNLASFRWSSSLNRIYVENGGSATLTDIKAALPSAALDLVDATNKIWLLRADLLVSDGCALTLHGAAAGGDVNELRLKSLNSAATGSVVSVTADWGTLDIDSTKITSWDTTLNVPDTEYQTNGRAYIRVRSSLATNGVDALESRMDIRNSELGYLGANASEAYGVVWKVVGTDPNPTNSIFNKVNVYGNVINSRLHDNYIGAYLFGVFGMQWLTNEVDHNAQYGLDLQSDSDSVEIRGNNFHHNGNHGLFASVRCDHLLVSGNVSWTNAQHGIFLDQSSDDSLVELNQCFDNGGSGIAVAASLRNTLRNNLLLRNQQAGVRLSLGSADNLVQGNECASNSLYGVFLQIGSGTPLPNDDGRPKRNMIVANSVHDNLSAPIQLFDGDDNTFATNNFTANGTKLRFQRGLRNWLDGNTIPAAMAARTEADTNSTASTYVRNQAALRVELGTNGATIFADETGRVYQPDEATVLTGVTSLGSTMNLTTTEIGASSMVVARNLWGSATPGTAFVHHLVWTNSANKQWAATAGSLGQNLHFTVGDLAPNTAYVVHKAGAALANLTSDASGQLQFSDTASTTLGVTYSIDPPTTNNTPPLLPPIADRTIFELVTLIVTNTASDSITPGYLLSYTLLSGPTNAVLSADGVITWTPTEAQGGTTNLFTTRVTDDALPPLSATNSFQVVVGETNAAPVLPVLGNVEIMELTALSVTNTATDSDVPTNHLSYALQSGPSNAVISANGIITWTPTAAQGPSTNTLTTVVTDDGVPPLSATNSLTVVVTEPNSAPILPVQTNVTLTELTTLLVTNTATDGNTPPNVLTYALQSGPSNAVVSTNGLITWMPDETQGPSTNTFTVVVTDDGLPPLSATNEFIVVVTEVNDAPVLPALSDVSIAESATLVVTNTATDADLPVNHHSYALQSGPGNALISTNGIITWSPTTAQGPSTNTFTTVVTDDGVPPLSATNSFTVVVTNVNSAPTLPVQANVTISESTTVLVTNTATDGDIPPNILTYALQSGPGNAVVSINGIVTWTPDETQGPSTNTFRVVVTDDGFPPLSATNEFTVVVTEVNAVPVLPVLSGVSIAESATLVVTNTATDADLPINHLSYALQSGPSNAVISANGIITWTPDETRGPSTNTFTTVVTDDGVPSLSATNSLTVVVTEVNSAPALPVQANVTISELTTLLVTNTATDADLPINHLSYALQSGPSNAVLSANGIITWTPDETQGPGTNIFTTVVTDDGVPPLSATNSLAVVVTEVNRAPALPVQVNVTISELTTLLVTNTATDPDLPANQLAYSLIASPAGAGIDASGIISWTAPSVQGSSTNNFTTVASDNGEPPLSVTNTFFVIVNQSIPVVLNIHLTSAQGLLLSWAATAPGAWVLQSAESLADAKWSDVGTGILVGDEYQIVIESLPEQLFFRLRRSGN